MIQKEIEDLIRPTVNDMGYELWGSEYLAQGKYSILRIFIDKPEGIQLADCERVSKRVSALLDVEDPISGNYNLEVSSPGIPRPLFNSSQYHRYIGQQVQVKLFRPLDGRRKITGVIVSANEDNLVLSIDNVEQNILFSNIVKASLV